MPPMDPACYGDGARALFSIPLARRVIGLEPGSAMLAHRQAVAPRADRAFDLVTAAGSLNYTHLPSALAAARTWRTGSPSSSSGSRDSPLKCATSPRCGHDR